ncbi:MAG: LptA/OstA family protein [Nitrospirota bacterium]
MLPLNILSAEEAKKIKGPIIITSEKLTADNQNYSALFENSVIAKASDITIYADRMRVYYHKDTGAVTKIDAEGRVKLIKNERVITSRKATYYAEEEKVVFTGEPQAVEGENVVNGKKMVYFLIEERFLVEGSKVFLKNEKQQ